MLGYRGWLDAQVMRMRGAECNGAVVSFAPSGVEWRVRTSDEGREGSGMAQSARGHLLLLLKWARY